MGWKNSLHGRAVEYDKNFLYLRGKPVGPTSEFLTRGKMVFVDSAVDGGAGENPDTALGTLDEAFAKCTAGNHDHIIVMPGHAETVTGAGGITADIDDVTVTGLGRGTQMPRFLMDGATTVTALITGDNVAFKNLKFAAGHNSIVRAIGVTGVGAWLEGLEFEENTTAEDFLVEIDATGGDNTADSLTVIGNRVRSLDATAGAFISITGNLAGLTVRDNVVVKKGGTASPLILQAGTKISTYVDIQWNFLQHAMTANDLFIDNGSSSNSGIVAHNRCRHADVTGAHSLVDMDGVGLFDNLSVSTNVLSGFVLPAIDVDL